VLQLALGVVTQNLQRFLSCLSSSAGCMQICEKFQSIMTDNSLQGVAPSRDRDPLPRQTPACCVEVVHLNPLASG
jgi:hypothetical protein